MIPTVTAVSADEEEKLACGRVLRYVATVARTRSIASVSGSAPFDGRLFEDSPRVTLPSTPDGEPLSVIARQKRGSRTRTRTTENSRASSSASGRSRLPSCEVFLPGRPHAARPRVGPLALLHHVGVFPLSTLCGAPEPTRRDTP